MAWRLVSGALAGAILALLLTVPVTAQSGPCDGAKVLVDARLYDAAIAAYSELLKPRALPSPMPTGQQANRDTEAEQVQQAKDQHECASTGIRDAAIARRADQVREYVQKGNALYDAGQLSQARDAYLQALALDSKHREAKEGLDAILAAQRMDAARELKKQGLRAAARSTLQRALSESPDDSAPNDLRDLLEADDPMLVWYVDQFLQRPVEVGQAFTTGVLVPIAVFVFVLAFSRLRLWPFLRSFWKVRLDVREFDKGATGLEIGKALSQMIEDELRRFDDPGSSRRPGMVTGSLQPLAPPTDVAAASQEVRWISAAIQWLIPPNIVILSGWILKPGDRGAGLTLELSSSASGGILSIHTFWLHDYDPWPPPAAPENPTPYYSLVEPAATWLAFQLDVYKHHGRIE